MKKYKYERCLWNKNQKSPRLEWNKVEPTLECFWLHTHMNNQNVKKINLQTFIESGIFLRPVSREREESRQWGHPRAHQNEVLHGRFLLGGCQNSQRNEHFFLSNPQLLWWSGDFHNKNSLNWNNKYCLFLGWKWCATGGEERVKWTLTSDINVRIQFKGK